MKRKVAKHTKRMHGNAVQSKIVRVYVTKDDIDDAECRNPTKCMIKVAVKRALNLAHGYIHVDATGISISRNGLYREKAFMTRTVLNKMLAFDRRDPVRPFNFTLSFQKTTKVKKYSSAEVEKKRQQNIKSGTAKRKYDMRMRVIGVAVAGGAELAA